MKRPIQKSEPEEVFRITKIETQKRNENRVSIFLNGAFAFGLDRETAIRHHLHEGDKLTGQEIEKVLLVEEIKQAKDKALSLLSYRDRSIWELKQRLTEKQFSEWSIEKVVADFKRAGLLDDRRFARIFVQSRMNQKPAAKRLILRELDSRGIEDAITAEAMETEYTMSEQEVAEALAVNRLKKLQNNNYIQKHRKVSGFLARRGFSWEIINSILRQLLKEE